MLNINGHNANHWLITLGAAVAISGVLAVGVLALASMDDGLGKVRVVITMDGRASTTRSYPSKAMRNPSLMMTYPKSAFALPHNQTPAGC